MPWRHSTAVLKLTSLCPHNCCCTCEYENCDGKNRCLQAPQVPILTILTISYIVNKYPWLWTHLFLLILPPGSTPWFYPLPTSGINMTTSGSDQRGQRPLRAMTNTLALFTQAPPPPPWRPSRTPSDTPSRCTNIPIPSPLHTAPPPPPHYPSPYRHHSPLCYPTLPPILFLILLLPLQYLSTPTYPYHYHILPTLYHYSISLPPLYPYHYPIPILP